MSKIAIFSDLHLGIKQDSIEWHNIALNWVDWFVFELRKRNIKDVAFLGDFFHTRNSISANTLHIASEVLNKLSEFNLYFILGNHDLYYANSPSVSPVNLFQGRGNIKVFAKPELVSFNSKQILFCGWGYNPEEYPNADVLFTHAEINMFKYNLVAGNCEEGYKASGLLEKFDLVYSGHFHLRQEKEWPNKRIVYVGNTFPMDHSDTYSTEKGFDILDLDTLTSEFVKNEISPKFYKLRLSELIENNKWTIEKLSNEVVPGNIFKIIIDLDITPTDMNILSNIITNLKPLEFSIEWENGKNFSQDIAEVELKAFDMEDAIKKYIELLDIPNKNEVSSYVLSLYEKARD